MNQITIKEAEKLNSPNPFALLTSCSKEGKQNVMAISWWTFASNNPATVVICISSRGYTHTLIEENNEFALCLPDESLKESAFLCGTKSGRDTEKADVFGIELENAEMIQPKLVKNSKVQMECKVINRIEVGDHLLFVGEAVCIHGDASAKHLLSENGYAKLNAY